MPATRHDAAPTVHQRGKPNWRALYLRAALLVFFLGLTASVSSRTWDDTEEYFFDFSALGEDGILLDGSIGRAQSQQLRLNYVRRSAPFDLLLIGNHNLRNFGGQNLPSSVRFFSLNNIQQDVFQLPALLGELTKQGKMPRQALIVSILAYAPQQWAASDDSPEAAADDGVGVASHAADTIVALDARIRRLIDSESFALGLVGRQRWLIPLSFAACRAAWSQGQPSVRKATGGIGGKTAAVLQSYWVKLSELLPVPLGLGTGLIDIATYCRTSTNFYRTASGYRYDGSSFGAKQDIRPLHNGAGQPALGEAEALQKGIRFAAKMRQIHEIAKRGGIPAIFVVPPRVQIDNPARRSADKIMDFAFPVYRI